MQKEYVIGSIKASTVASAMMNVSLQQMKDPSGEKVVIMENSQINKESKL